MDLQLMCLWHAETKLEIHSKQMSNSIIQIVHPSNLMMRGPMWNQEQLYFLKKNYFPIKLITFNLHCTFHNISQISLNHAIILKYFFKSKATCEIWGLSIYYFYYLLMNFLNWNLTQVNNFFPSSFDNAKGWA